MSALERQVNESVRIEEFSAKEQECLILRSEWGVSKLPEILVLRPKSTTDRVKEGEGVRGKKRELNKG